MGKAAGEMKRYSIITKIEIINTKTILYAFLLGEAFQIETRYYA